MAHTQYYICADINSAMKYDVRGRFIKYRCQITCKCGISGYA